MLSLDKRKFESKMGFKILIIIFSLSIGISMLSFSQYSQIIPGAYGLKYLFFFCFVFGLICLYRNRLMVLSQKDLMVFFLLTISMIPSVLYTDIQSINSSILLITLSAIIGFASLFIFPKISERSFLKLLKVLLFLIFFIIIIPSFLLSFNQANYYIIGHRIRFVGNFNNPNELARFSALGFLITARILPDIRKVVGKMVLLVLMTIAVYIIYITDSRAALLLCGLSTVMFVFNWSYIKISKRATLFITILLVVPLILIIGLHKVIVEYRVLGMHEIDQLLSGRLNIWANLLKERSNMELIFGSGTERSGLVATLVLTNGYVEILMYFGILGLFQWLGLIIYLLHKKVKTAISSNTISQFNGVAIIIAFLIYYMFEGGLISVGNIAGIYFWLELSQAKD